MVNPAIFAIIGLSGATLGSFLLSISTNNATFVAAVCAYHATQFFGPVFRVIGMKIVSFKEQGTYSATMFMMNDLVGIISNKIIGVVAENNGYFAMWRMISICLLCSLIAFIILDNTYLNRLRRNNS